MHCFSDLFDKVIGQVHCPSSGVSQHCIQAIGICHASSVGCLLGWSGWPHYQTANWTSMTNTYCMYTVLRYSWWWTVDLSKTCRVLYQINLRNSASRWLLLWEYIMMHSPLNVKFRALMLIGILELLVRIIGTIHLVLTHSKYTLFNSLSLLMNCFQCHFFSMGVLIIKLIIKSPGDIKQVN